MKFASKNIHAAMVFFAIAGPAAQAEAPTYSRDIAPIMEKSCVGCHRPGEIGPMPLTSYDEVRPWAKSILKTVSNREMPPWDADPAFGHWANDISLTDAEVAAITAWAGAGAPQGEPAAKPAAKRDWPTGWTAGEPDMIIDLPEMTIPTGGPDLFPDHVITIDLPEGKWLSAAEILPGNREVLHHVVAFLGEAAMRANAQGEAAPPTLSGTDIAIAAIWAAGMPPTVNPPGTGHPLKTKQTFTFNMHYHPSGTEATDKTRVGLHFGEGELQKKMRTTAGLNTGFNIPPGDASHESRAFFYISHDSQIVSFFPHMHLRGKDFEYRITRPDGVTETLLRVPNYDFNWQWIYYPKTAISAPAGSLIEVVGHFDNSKANPNNPDPESRVTFGEETGDEMLIGFMELVPTEGVQFPPDNAVKFMTGFLNRDPASEKFLMLFGMPSIAAGLEITRDKGEGAFYFYAGSALARSPIKDIAWNGDHFEGKVTLFMYDTTFIGDIAADNTISITMGTPEIIGEASPQAKFLYRMVSNMKGKRISAPVEVTQAK